MKNKKIFNKILSVFIALLMVFSVSTVSSIKAFADEVLTPKVHVIIENETYRQSDGAPWEGKLVDDWIDIKSKMTMMDAIVEAIEKNDLTQNGADSGYISEINGLAEKQGGDLSGWMGTKNDWMVNQSFDKFEVEENDEIKVMYTKDAGVDLGADYANKTTTLKDISFSSGSLSTDFSSDTKEYTLELGDTEKIKVNPTASNKNYQVRIYKGENPDVSTNGYKRSEEIKVLDGDVITVICGDKSWDGSDTTLDSSVYTFNIKSNIKPNTAPALNKESDSQTINLGETYSVDLSTIFTDAENDKLSYIVSINGKEQENIDVNYSFKPENAGNYELEFRANDGREISEPYTVKLAVDDGKIYKVNLQDTENGSIEVDIKEGKLNTTVTLTVKPDDGFAMDTLEIKDKDGNDIKRTVDQDSCDGVNWVYKFELPTSDVNIYATFEKGYTYNITGLNWYMAFVDVYNKYGEVVTPKLLETYQDPFHPDLFRFEHAEYYLTLGTYSYTFYKPNDTNDGRGNATKQGIFTVEDTEKIQLKSFFSVNIEASCFYLEDTSDDNGNVNIKITDTDGNVVNEKPANLYIDIRETDGKICGYYYTYLLETEGKRDEQYKFEITPVNKENILTLKLVQGATNYSDNEIYFVSTSPRYNPTHPDCIYRCVNTELEKPDTPVEYKVNKGAGLHMYRPYGVAYKQFDEIEPLSVDTTSDSEYDIYKFNLSSAHYMLMAGGGDSDYVKTYKSYFYIDIEEVTEPVIVNLIKKEDYEKNSYSGTKWDDIYTNIKDEGSYVNMDVGESKRLETFRVWQGTTSPVSNKFFEPDKHYEVIYGSDCLTLTEGGGEGRQYMTMTAKKEGIAVIKITYDDMYEISNTRGADINMAKKHGFNAIQEEHTGIVIVNVGGSRGDIEPNIKVRDRDWIKYDTFYFTGDTTYPDGTVVKGKGYGEYTFTPSEGVTVEAHDPIHIDEDFGNNWTKYEPNEDGSYTIKLKTGRNIIRLTKGDDVVYFAMNAMQSDITISNKTNEGQPLKVGDEASVSFTNIECPVYKMTAIYNPGFPDRTYMVYNLNGKTIEGPHSQYAVQSPITFKVNKSGTYILSQGKIHGEHMGSPLDTHCIIPDDGLPPNLNAGYGSNDVNFSILPDVEIKVEKISQDESTVLFDADNGNDVVTKSVKLGEALDYEPEVPTKEGYTFVGWYEDTDNTKTKYKNKSTYTEDVIYKAKWAHVDMLGAQVKIVVDDKSGIRFGTKIYNDGDEIVEKGTIILPANLLQEGESLTLDTPQIARSVGKVNYEVNEEENYVTYLGTLIGIPRAQFDTEIIASSYVIYKDKSGNEYTVYSPYKKGSTTVNTLLNSK